MNAELLVPHRPRLLALAYRLTGSVATAEDVVQEAWVRFAAASDVAAPAGWATTVVTRLCLDELRSARARREAYVGPWLPEPWVDDAPPPPGLLGETLSLAFLLLLETLSPKERAAWLLREVFEEEYERVAEVLGTSEAAARQLVVRANRALSADRPRFDADPAAHLALLAAFGAAVGAGDLDALRGVLHAEVVATSDGGGVVGAARRPIVGPDRVARFLLGVARKAPPGFTSAVAWVNGAPGLVGRTDGRLSHVFAVTPRDGRIWRWWAVLAPAKLLGSARRAGG